MITRDELPRLTDEERDALDAGYVAIEGVPAHGEPAHTPGPWEVADNEHGDQTRRFIWPVADGIALGCEDHPCSDTYHCVAIVDQRGDVSVLEANARLIAAAPSLLAALKDLCDDAETVARDSFAVSLETFEQDWEREDPSGFAMWKAGCDAIEKAEGRRS